MKKKVAYSLKNTIARLVQRRANKYDETLGRLMGELLEAPDKVTSFSRIIARDQADEVCRILRASGFDCTVQKKLIHAVITFNLKKFDRRAA